MKKLLASQVKVKRVMVHILMWLLSASYVKAAEPPSPPPEQSVWEGMRKMITPIGQIFGYPQGVPTDIRVIAFVIIRVLFMVFVIVFFSLIFYGGYTWMMAKGDEQKVEKAQGILRNSIVGLAIVFTSYAITRFIVTALICAIGPYSEWCLFFAGIT